MLIDLRQQKRTGKQVQDIADTVGITLNRNSIPFDDASKFNPSGVRVGTPLVTTRGMREAEMVVIADCIADLVERIDDRWSMRPVVKLAVQIGLSLLAVVVFNFQIGYIGLPGGRRCRIGGLSRGV